MTTTPALSRYASEGWWQGKCDAGANAGAVSLAGLTNYYGYGYKCYWYKHRHRHRYNYTEAQPLRRDENCNWTTARLGRLSNTHRL